MVELRREFLTSTASTGCVKPWRRIVCNWLALIGPGAVTAAVPVPRPADLVDGTEWQPVQGSRGHRTVSEDRAQLRAELADRFHRAEQRPRNGPLVGSRSSIVGFRHGILDGAADSHHDVILGEMELRDRLIGPVASLAADHETATVDFGDLVRKLALFDEVILESIRLKEFPLFVQKFGYAAVKELLESGRMLIHCDALTIGQIGQTTILESRARKGALPFGSYSFAVVKTHDHRNYIHENLQPINDVPGLSDKQARGLRKLVAERVVTPPPESGQQAMAQFERDLEMNVPNLKASIAVVSAREFGKQIDPHAFDLRVERIDAEDFKTETNLGEILRLDAGEVHKAVELGLLGVGGLNQRLEYMERYRAMTGFRADELPLFEDKLSFLARQLDPDAQAERFERVLELADLPDVDPDPNTRDVDLSRLLEILGSDEAREFRTWLRGLDSLDDAEVACEISRLRDLVRRAVHSRAGKIVRFTATTGIGLIPGAQLAAIGMGALDSFVLEKLVPEAGPTAFLSRLYPTIFIS